MSSKVIENTNKSTNENTIKSQPHKRIDYIDIARGIAIICMVIGHNPWNTTLTNVIYSFHMPLFIIVSGIFFKDNENFSDFIKKLFKGIFIPYFLALSIEHILRVLFYHPTNITLQSTILQIIFSRSDSKPYVSYVGVLWFLPLLFTTKLLFWTINKISKRNNYIKGICCLFLSILGISLGICKLTLPWSLDIALASLPFIYSGYILKKYNLLEKILTDYKLLIIVVFIYIFGMNFGRIELVMRLYPHNYLCFVTAITGTLIVFKISKLIEKFLPFASLILRYFGKNSMYVLILHNFEIHLIPYKNMGVTKSPQIALVKLLIISISLPILLKIIYFFKHTLKRRLIKC